MLSRAGRLAAAALVLPLLSACSTNPLAGNGGASPSGGFVVVTAGGSALVDGENDVPPTLDLRVQGTGLSAGDVQASLDGRALTLQQQPDAVTASVPPMPLGSAHALDLSVPGRDEQHIAFHVAPAAGAAAALHVDGGSTVLDLAFQFAPSDRAAVEGALPPGGGPQWSDPTHLRAAWPAAPGGNLTLSPTLQTARGSHLAAPLVLSLAPVAPGTLRRTSVPAPASGATPKPLVVAFTVATAASRASLAAHADRISIASPTGLHVGDDGRLTGQADPPAVATAAAHDLPVWPLIQNDASDPDAISRVLTDGAAVGRLVGQAAALDFPGVHLDIEGVPAGNRDDLTHLVDRLAAALHAKGKKLAVAVVPHKPGHLNLYSAAYDLTAIARDADLVTLMAYDQHTASTDPGPVAGLDWDRQVLEGSLAELHDNAIALLGLPLYSRSWDNGDVTADAYASSLRRALDAAGARVDYDFNAQTPLVHYGDGAVLWFDDAQSLAAKQALVIGDKLRGIAMWRLGFEDPAVWDALPPQR